VGRLAVVFSPGLSVLTQWVMDKQIRNSRPVCRFVTVFVVLVVVCSSTALAQSTILNIPSSDVMARGQFYVEADLISHPTSFKESGFLWYGPSVIYGLGKSVEVGINAYIIKDASPTKSIELQPNVKWKCFDNEDNGVSSSIGAMVFLPLTRRDQTSTAGMFYAVVAKKVGKEFGPRFTTGAYGLVGRREGTKSKAGPLVGYEQPLGRRLTFMADWYGGRNLMGYVAGGFGLTLTKNSTLYASYNFGNEGRGNNWLGIYYGLTF
jgi:hypothetical protein